MRQIITGALVALTFSMLAPQGVNAQNNNGQVHSSKSENKPLNSLRDRVNQSRAVRPSFSGVTRQVPNRRFKEDTRAVEQDNLDFSPSQVQSFDGPLASTSLTSFNGASNADNATINGYRVMPPDTDGQVGPNHFVQMINSLTAAYDKNGNELGGGPFATNDFWIGLGGPCETTNDGDPIVIYDENDDRWLISQFAISEGSNYRQCVAISQTGDPLGGYNRYAFDFSGIGFNDYPKHGIVSNSITIMANIFGGSFTGTYIGAMDKAAMYAGNTATMVGQNIGTSEFGFVAADLDGPDPGNVPALFATAMSRSNLFDIWQVNPNFSNPGATTVSRIAAISIDPYNSNFCSANREACITQPSPGNSLETLSDRLMHRLQVRDYGSYRSMVASHAVNVGSGIGGIKWYEMRESGGTWSKHQEGIFAPNDGNNRWMPSIAKNAAGDIGIGYSISSASTFWSIGVAGQTASQSGSGIMNSAETVCRSGGGVQTGGNRSGDYSSTSVDPVTDTFWHTNEYVISGGNFVWDTGVCEFELDDTPVVLPTSMFVSNLTTGSVSANGNRRRGTATVTVTNDQGDPVSGASVSGDFSGTFTQSVSGTTNGSGQVTFTTSGKQRGTPTVNFCVSDVSGSLSYDPADNSNPGYACSGGPGGGTSIHIASLTFGTSGNRRVRGTANVTIQDDQGNPVSGVSVSGQFGGSFNESDSGTTGTNGSVSFQTSARLKTPVTVDFCVTSVSGSLPYEPADNGSPAWDCDPGFKIVASGDESLSFIDRQESEAISFNSNYPNPFNPTTLIPFAIGKERHVRATVYNSIGQRVAVLADGIFQAGNHRLVFDATSLNNGMYFLSVESGDFSYSQRMTLMK